MTTDFLETSVLRFYYFPFFVTIVEGRGMETGEDCYTFIDRIIE
jgi:hypothetical protein